MGVTDPEIIAMIREGKELDKCIRVLYKNHFSSLSWHVMNNNGSEQDAEDVFQDVIVSFIDLVQQDKFRGQSSIRTFLFAMNRHTWLNELKKRKRKSLREEKFEFAKDKLQPDVSDSIVKQETDHQLISLVGNLGETCRKILLMFYFENLSIREILQHLDYENEQVVRNKKGKCLKELSSMIHENEELKLTMKNRLNG